MNIAEILGISSVSDVNVTNQTENIEFPVPVQKLLLSFQFHFPFFVFPVPNHKGNHFRRIDMLS